jgi:acyl-CoA synthetase (AMP-forming)/AMP-acid ligase II
MLPVGYFGDEKKTRESFLTIDGVKYALGGDAARLEEDRSITVLGRGSMCINSGGEKIFPEEVESTLKGYDAVDDVLVVGIPHKKWGQQVAAVYCANTDEVSENDLRNFCRASLAGYKVPKLFIRVEKVQRTVVGKPDYKWAKSVAEQLQ